MKQRDLFQFAPPIAPESAGDEKIPSRPERSPTPTWSEAKWDEQGELAFAE